MLNFFSWITRRVRTAVLNGFRQAAEEIEAGGQDFSPAAPDQLRRSFPAPGRRVFVSLETSRKVLDACPDAEWRLIFALSRFGGLRCPLEHLALTWSDVDWERSRFRVGSLKIGIRWVPIFADLKPYLEEAWDLAPEGTEYVIERYRGQVHVLRLQLLRILRRAGIAPWPSLFQSLRASRETELAAGFPIHVVHAWIGRDGALARKQVSEADFLRAANEERGDE